jgi:phage/plasmid primase-like uncharacterized protein
LAQDGDGKWNCTVCLNYDGKDLNDGHDGCVNYSR